MFFRSAVVALSVLSLLLSGCTTVRGLTSPYAKSAPKSLEAGDRVHVTLQNGRSHDLVLSRVSRKDLEGTTIDGKTMRLSYETIKAIEVRRVDTARTIFAVIFFTALSIGLLDLLLPTESVD